MDSRRKKHERWDRPIVVENSVSHPYASDEETYLLEVEELEDREAAFKSRKQVCLVAFGALSILCLVGLIIYLSIVFSHFSKQSSQVTLNCKQSIVGAGLGGLYYAYRLSQLQGADGMCIFEASDTRIGGRVFSYFPEEIKNDTFLDLGSYRFSLGHEITRGLIKHLGIPVTCYSEGHCSEGYETIQSTYGNIGGYHRLINTLANEFYRKGGKLIYMGHELKNIETHTWNNFPPISLTFKNGVTVRTDQVFLNLPPSSLCKLDKGNAIATDSVLQALLNVKERPSAKLYLRYDDAWWMTKLNITTGTATFNDGLLPLLNLKFADGFITCHQTQNGISQRVSRNSSSQGCSGFLLASLNWDSQSVEYFKSLSTKQERDNDVLITINRGDDREWFLTVTHQRLMDLYGSLLISKGRQPSSIASPTSAVISIWDSEYHYRYPSIHYLANDEGVAIEDENWEVRNDILKPLPDFDIFIGNEAYSNEMGWGESSLVLVERILNYRYRYSKPAWVSDFYYQYAVTPNMPPPKQCFEARDCIFNNTCVVGTCQNGHCVYTPSVGQSCDDRNACTNSDVCTSEGTCEGTPIVCSNPTDFCLAGTCLSPSWPSMPRCSYQTENFKLYWEYVNNDEIRVAFTLPGLSMVGLGLGTSMTGADMVVGWVYPNGQFSIDDYYSISPSLPQPDTVLGGSNDLTNLYAFRNESDKTTTIWFQRKLNTGDQFDNVITKNAVNDLLYAWSTETNQAGLFYHHNDKSLIQVNLTC